MTDNLLQIAPTAAAYPYLTDAVNLVAGSASEWRVYYIELSADSEGLRRAAARGAVAPTPRCPPQYYFYPRVGKTDKSGVRAGPRLVARTRRAILPG